MGFGSGRLGWQVRNDSARTTHWNLGGLCSLFSSDLSSSAFHRLVRVLLPENLSSLKCHLFIRHLTYIHNTITSPFSSIGPC